MNEREILASTYLDTCTVTRPTPTADGVFDDYVPTVIYKAVPCALSFRGTTAEARSDTTQAVEYLATLFVDPEIRILPGDEIAVAFMGTTREFLAGEAAIYPSHAEVPLLRKTVA